MSHMGAINSSEEQDELLDPRGVKDYGTDHEPRGQHGTSWITTGTHKS